MNFDTDPAEDRFQLDQCIDEIHHLKERLELAEAVCEHHDVSPVNDSRHCSCHYHREWHASKERG